MVSQQQKIQHLFLRAGFGETPARIKSCLNKTLSEIIEELFASSQAYKEIDYLPFPLNEREEEKGISGFKVILMILKSKKDLEELNNEWIFKMAFTKAALRERMTFFWHNHFATSAPFAYLMQVQNNTLRKHALGKFSDLLHTVAKDQAMIIYLNNQQNHKNHPNENFAREVMELFTLGVGNYTEKDIKEAARAFTGWTVNSKGQFEFKKNDHDDGEKEFFGKKGNFSGEDILNILLENQQTAKYIVTKIYREFVNTKINAQRVEALAKDFYGSGYDISILMKSIFTSDWFYEEENIGSKICSPVELIVRYKKLFDLEVEDGKKQVEYQRALGQVLFFPPNVAGWKGGESWIDSTSLLLRMNLAQFVYSGTAEAVKAKPAFEEDAEEGIQKQNPVKIKSDWKEFVNAFNKEQNPQQALLDFLIQCDKRRIDLKNSSDIMKASAEIMSLPEFQLI